MQWRLVLSCCKKGTRSLYNVESLRFEFYRLDNQPYGIFSFVRYICLKTDRYNVHSTFDVLIIYRLGHMNGFRRAISATDLEKYFSLNIFYHLDVNTLILVNHFNFFACLTLYKLVSIFTGGQTNAIFDRS